MTETQREMARHANQICDFCNSGFGMNLSCPAHGVHGSYAPAGETVEDAEKMRRMETAG